MPLREPTMAGRQQNWQVEIELRLNQQTRDSKHAAAGN
jgi:hypothetical protein